MSTTEALYRLTSNEKDKWDEEDEWLVIKVPKRTQHKIFYVDYCDGDSEDELHWLEGPYLQEEISVADLLEFRRAQPRSSRRRRGLAEFRDDPEEDGKDPHGYQLPNFPRYQLPNPIPLDLQDEPLDLSEDQKDIRRGRRCCCSPSLEDQYSGPSSPAVRAEKEEASDTALMTNNKKEGQSAPLHDMTCLGIDTCSARSISCLADDFLDLRLVENDKLRGVGGTTGVSGKGVMVIWAKDINDKTIMIIEPDATFIENAPAQYRLIGQMRMKEMGVPLTQDYDDKGTDVLKCKRSGTMIPLRKGNGIQLLKTFKY